MNLTRRAFNTALATSALVAAVGLSPFELIARAFAEDAPNPADLASPSPLGDIAFGKPDAAVTIVEYASMSCTHCAHFHEKVYPKLKAEYIDTGKVRFIFREFPLDQKAIAGSMLARCIAGSDANKYFAVVGVLFKTQDDWAFGNNTERALRRLGRTAGLSDKATEACITDPKTFEALKSYRDEAEKKLGVDATPTFFINGKVLRGGAEIAEFREILDPLLKS